MFNGRRLFVYAAFGVVFSLVVSSVLYFGVYPVISTTEARFAEGGLVMSGDIRFFVNTTHEYPNLILLEGDRQVRIDGGVSVDSTETVDAASWGGEQEYYLGVSGASGNSIHAILEFYFFGYLPEQNADVYGVRITAKTSPNPIDSQWRLDNGGVDDRNGPASEVRASVSSVGLLDGEPRLPVDSIVDASYYGRWGFSVAIYKESVSSGEEVDFVWKLGLDAAVGERTEALGTYLLVLTVAHQQTVHIDDLEFRGNLWRSGTFWVDHVWAIIEDISISYYG